jgi:hypothetical protein
MLEHNDDPVYPEWHRWRGSTVRPRSSQAPNFWRELNFIKFLDPPNRSRRPENDHAYDAAYRVAVMFEQARYRRAATGPAVRSPTPGAR